VNQVLVKIHPWENSVFAESTQEVEVGDVVITETADEVSAGIVDSIALPEKEVKNSQKQASAKIVRKANISDLKIITEQRKKATEAMALCHKEIKESKLPMKIVGAQYSFDGGSVTFAFIADGRIDFRDLVKVLSKQLQRSVKLYQIGARDESRQSGGYGICGRELCCVKFKGNLPSITSEMAKVQQIAHRGSERISGLCGRLMCCLSYEADQYREMLEKFPKIGDSVKYNGEKVIVKDVNALKGEIRGELEDKSFVTIKLTDIKK
jgi:cell fate regulator YaaT (PSP1 superfamily)